MACRRLTISSAYAIVLIMSLGAMPLSAASMLRPTPDEMAEARRFVAAKFESPQLSTPPVGLFSADPPFSFAYNGKPSSEFLGTWKVDRKIKKIDEHRTGHTITYSDPAGGLSVRCEAVEYDDFPTVEWTLYFMNTGVADTPIIENIQSLDVRWQRGANEFLLHYNIGSPADGTDYTPLESVLDGNSTKRLGAAGGRSTGAYMSYFNLERNKDDGLIVVVGWPGQWAVEFIRDQDQGLRLKAGQELTHFKLLPGEEVRTPLSVLQFWKGGDWIRSQNIWRRWMIAHNMPRPGGKLPAPMLLAYSGGAYQEMYKATEETQLMWFNRYLEEKIKLDYWWMDAGWYQCDPEGWPKVGTWEVDKKRFPRGLRAITDYVHSKGTKTLLWFEPERVSPGTWLAENHPEWILGGKKGGLLNLGNPDALKWVTEHIDKVLVEEGIDLYRQDFNMDPLFFWRSGDTPDRLGITEIRYVEGYLAYWDELRRRHPDMLIDSCASGGRRNDLETLRRAVPFVRSDYIFEEIGQQCHSYAINWWMPYHGTGTFLIEPYHFWSTMAPHVTPCWDMRDKNLDYDLLRRWLGQWRQIAPYYYGDYYALSPYSLQDDTWMAWQFDRPDLNEGFVQAFRRTNSYTLTAEFSLRGLNPTTRYKIMDLDGNNEQIRIGSELMEKGLPITINNCPGATVIIYKKM